MGDTPDSGGTEIPRRFPPRYWWLKRILIAAGVVLVLMTGLRLWWGIAADRALDGKVAELRAAGFGVYPEDVNTQARGDSTGVQVWRDVLAAVAAVPAPAPFKASDPNWPLVVGDIILDPNNVVARPKASHALLADYKDSLALLRSARDVDNGHWSIPWGCGVARQVSGLSLWRELMKAAGDAAIYDWHQGNHASAVEYLRDMLVVRRALCQRNGELVDALIAAGISAYAARGIETLAHDLVVEPHAAPRGVSAVPRDDVRALIRDFLDKTPDRNCWCSAMHRQRYYTLDVLSARFGMLPPGLRSPAPVRSYRDARWWVLGPAWVGAATSALGELASMQRDALADTLPATTDHRDGPGRECRIEVWNLFSNITRPSTRAAVRLTRRARASRRMAAIALALRLYELDCGHLPPTLDALVPQYLDKLPIDPFNPSGATFGYIPDTTPVWLYSVYEDGVDNGGTVVSSETGKPVPRGTRLSSSKTDQTCSDLLFRYGPKPAASEPAESSDSPGDE